jgi:hypothetical protein
MKRIWILAMTCLSVLSSHALVVNVDGYGQLPAEVMEITISEAQKDPLTGKDQMGIKGTLFSTEPVSVMMLRSAEGLQDEFCCAGQCTAGNGLREEYLEFAPKGVENWYAHYTPVAGSNEQITYIFSDGWETLTLIVHYNFTTQSVENVQRDEVPCTKIIKDGILYIIKNNKTYTIL